MRVSQYLGKKFQNTSEISIVDDTQIVLLKGRNVIFVLSNDNELSVGFTRAHSDIMYWGYCQNTNSEGE